MAYLPGVESENASIHTVRSHRDTWRVVLRFVAQRTGKKVAMIALADLAASEVATFLSHVWPWRYQQNDVTW